MGCDDISMRWDRRAFLVGTTAAALLATVAATTAGDGASLAGRILKAVDRPVGLAHLPRCGAGELALALAEADANLLVHGQDADEARVRAARTKADRLGLLGRRAWFDVGGTGRLLPAGRSADLVVLASLAAGDLTDALAGELRRVLHPWYGLAVLGDASGKLDAEALAKWARAIGPEVAPLAGEGTLVTVRAGPLKGADDWPMWWHGADNNAVSSDTAYGLPETIQWTGKPYASTRLPLPIVAGGRVFMLWNGHLLDTTRGEPILPGEKVDLPTHGWQTVMDAPLDQKRGPLLTARTVGSGGRLWHRRLSPAVWLQVARSSVVADGERLLVADGPHLLELDAATGRERRRVKLDCGEIRWLAVADGRVLVLGGPQFPNRFPERMRRMEANVAPFRQAGLLLAVLDARSLEAIWRHRREKGPDAFDPRSPAAAGGKLFVCTEGGVAEAYAVADGKRLWRRETGIVRKKPRGYEWDRSSRHPVSGYVVAGLYVLSGPETDRCAVLGVEDGKPRWDLPRGGAPVGPIPLAFDGLLWVGRDVLDPVTGKPYEPLGKVSLTRGGCSRYTASPQGIFGTEGLTWDAVAGKSRQVLPAKSSCAAGQYVANGLVWKFPTACMSCMEWRGFIPRARAEETLPPPGPRLVRGPRPDVPRAKSPGWASYRGDARRSCSVAATVSERAVVAWRAAYDNRTGPIGEGQGVLLEAEDRTVPPVVGGETVVVGRANGALDAYDLRTGRRRWRARTGGRLFSSPTVADGRVFVGAADGILYALALDDGRELWRLRVAPEAGRIMLYGQLGSRWPVLGSPLVRDGRVYAVAGLLEMIDGVHAVCADVATGKLLWHRGEWSGAGTHNVLAGGAQMCAADRRIVFQGGQAPLVVLDPDDGSVAPLFGDKEVSPGHHLNRGSMGQEVAAFAPGVVLFGGRRLLTEDREHGAWRNSLTFRVAREGGQALYLRMRPYGPRSASNRMPAWDDRDVACVYERERRKTRLALIPREAFLAALDAASQAKAAGRWDVHAGAKPLKLDLDRRATWQSEDFGYGCDARGCALTGNAAVVLMQKLEKRPGPGGEVRGRYWHVAAFARADGKRMWELDLPSVPVYEGLAVAADGRVVVTLRDGTVLCAAPASPEPAGAVP